MFCALSEAKGMDIKMSNRVITISREFGSGVRTIGKNVAEKLGIPCYDADIIIKLFWQQQETGMKIYLKD